MDGDLLGQTLGERYHFEELLGEGSFARVYRITDLNRRATLAAKVLRHDIAQDETFLERFRREAAVLARLQHPNIVRYYDTVETDGALFILMDYVPGSTLETELAGAAEPLKPADTLPILTPLASALHFAHYEGVIHRDLKPANILIHTNGTLLVTDFGIARILNATSELTLGISIGTPFYMAPEQITGGLITPATDIYALGIILYRMVTGRVPFRGERPGTSGTSTSARITYEHVHLEPEPPRYLNPALDLAVEEVILRCLDKNPARRYQSAGLFYDAFTEAIGAPPVSLGSPAQDQETPPPRPPEWSQLIAPVERKRAPTPPPADRTINRIEHPVPLPPTQPHLEDALRSASQQRTIPSLGRLADSLPAPRRVHATPSSYTAPISPPRAHRSNWALIAALAGVFLVVGVTLAAAVYLVLSAGESPEPTPVATSPELPVSPAPTIDRGGNQIAFDSQRGGSLDIYIMNVDGSDFRQLTGSSGAERGPAWSPDASQIAFYGAAAEDANYDIFVINTDGTGLHNVTNSPTVDEKYPTWSPDGTRLAFHSNADGDYDLYIINLDGSGLRAITNDDADDLGPDWSPEGTQIVFHTDLWGEPYEIALLDLNSLEVRRLTDNDDTNAFPTWSPDGTQIAYHAISSVNGVLNIFVMRMDTFTARQITTRQSSAFPDWSPDGTRIIYQSGEPNASAIYVIPLEGGTPEPLTGPQANFLPEWEPFKN